MKHLVEVIAVLQLVNEGFVGIQEEGGCVVRMAMSGKKSQCCSVQTTLSLLCVFSEGFQNGVQELFAHDLRCNNA